MKRFAKLFTVLAASLCAAVMLTACGDSVKGRYVAVMEEEGLTMEVTIELKGGGKAALSGKPVGEIPGLPDGMDFDASFTYEATYKLDGEKITITAAADGYEGITEGTLKDGTLTIDGQEYKKK